MRNVLPVNRGWRKMLLVSACSVSLVALGCQDGNDPAEGSARHQSRMAAASHVRTNEAPVDIEMFAPGDGDRAGVNGVGWFVDIDLEFDGGLAGTGFVKNQLTGPGIHENAAPFPGTFTPGKDDAFGGLVVLISTTTVGAGSCQNVADLFNITGPTVVTPELTEIWDTWIITAPNFGTHTPSQIFVAEVRDLNGDGIHNDAPNVVPDANSDGQCNEGDLKALGLDSKVVQAHFFIN
jgi:hypothetical protein